MRAHEEQKRTGLGPRQWLGYLTLMAVSVAGIGTIVVTLLNRDIHAHVATTQHVPWGLWVAMYIFFLGLSAGSFLLSTLVYVFGVKRLESVGPMALFQALACLFLGGILILLDLGHPVRVYNILLHMNTSSVMAWMGIFYNLYILVLLIELHLATRPALVRRAQQKSSLTWLYRLLSLGSKDLSQQALDRDRQRLRFWGIVGIPTAIIVHGGVGAIFAVAKARPNWFGGLFPIIFLISALASGGALLTFLAAFFSRQPKAERLDLVRTLSRLTLGILAFDILLLGSEILVTIYGEVIHEEIGWKLTLFGPFWWVFWFVQILGGFLIPVILITLPRTGRSIFALGLAGLLIVVGIFGTRLNIVIPPLIQPAFDTLPDAYYHPRWAWGYTPSGAEWLMGLGVTALGAWMFLLGRKVLPLEGTEAASSLPGPGESNPQGQP